MAQAPALRLCLLLCLSAAVAALDLVPIPRHTLHKRDDGDTDYGSHFELLDNESFYWGGDGKLLTFRLSHLSSD